MNVETPIRCGPMNVQPTQEVSRSLWGRLIARGARMFKSKTIGWITALTLLTVAGMALACRLKDGSTGTPQAFAANCADDKEKPLPPPTPVDPPTEKKECERPHVGESVSDSAPPSPLPAPPGASENAPEPLHMKIATKPEPEEKKESKPPTENVTPDVPPAPPSTPTLSSEPMKEPAMPPSAPGEVTPTAIPIAGLSEP